MLNEREYRDFPGGSGIGWSFTFSVGSIPGQEAQIPHAWRPRNQNIKQKHYYRKFKKDFKNGPHQKNIKKKSVQLKKRERENMGTAWELEVWPPEADCLRPGQALQPRAVLGKFCDPDGLSVVPDTAPQVIECVIMFIINC